VRVPAQVASSHSTTFLDELGQAVAQTKKERACI
jgi:hypothetical protein